NPNCAAARCRSRMLFCFWETAKPGLHSNSMSTSSTKSGDSAPAGMKTGLSATTASVGRKGDPSRRDETGDQYLRLVIAAFQRSASILVDDGIARSGVRV